MRNSPALFTNTHLAHSEEGAPFHLCEPTMEEYSAEMLHLKTAILPSCKGFVTRGRRKHVYMLT